MGACTSRKEKSIPRASLPSEVLEHLFSFLSVPDLLLAAGVCTNWRSEAFRAIKSRTGEVLLLLDRQYYPYTFQYNMLVREHPSKAIMLREAFNSLGKLQKIYDVNVVIYDNYSCRPLGYGGLPQYVNMANGLGRRILADELCKLQRVELCSISTEIALAFFSALASRRRMHLKVLVLHALPGYLPWSGYLARGLLSVQKLEIAHLAEGYIYRHLLLAMIKNVGKLKSLTIGCSESPFGFNYMTSSVNNETETLAKALNQVEELSLDLRGHTSFGSYTRLKATLQRLAAPGGSNLKCLKLKNLDNNLTRNIEPNLWVEAVSSLALFSLQVSTFNFNREGLVEDSFAMQVPDIMEVLVTVPGERVDKIVGADLGEERHFHIHPFGVCSEKCLEFSV